MSKTRTFALLTALFAFALLCAGCSSESPVGPAATDEPNPTGAEKGMTCTVYGNVHDINGNDAVGVQVVIYGMFPPSYYFVEIDRVTTGQYGSFSRDIYLYSGCQIRCASMGDVETRTWPGGAYMYFGLEQQRGWKTPYDPHEDPIPEP